MTSCAIIDDVMCVIIVIVAAKMVDVDVDTPFTPYKVHGGAGMG